MNTVLYFSPNGVVYETRAYSNADIAELVDNYGLESLTSTDRQFDFWFTPSTRRVPPQSQPQRHRNAFGHNSVHCQNSAAAPRRSCGRHPQLSRRARWAQLAAARALIQNSFTLTRRDDRVLSRRITRDERRQQRNLVAEDAATRVRLGQHPVARH